MLTWVGLYRVPPFSSTTMTTQQADADVGAQLLLSLVPAAVWRAERALLRGDATEANLRHLLEFHQHTVEPLSSIFSYALPCERALSAIARHSPAGVVELGAGTGLWATLLRKRGVTVHAYDATRHACAFGEVELGGPDSVSRHEGMSLLPVSYTHLTLPTTPFV